jgi:hypothetical protein
MVVRYAVQCPGCNAKILLRLGVGNDQQQPFFYVCGKCRAATKGVLSLNELSATGTELKLEDGQLLTSDEGCTQTIHLHPDFPGTPDETELQKSAFMFHADILGVDEIVAFDRKVALFDQFVKEDWPALKRLTTYYMNRDWNHFDSGLSALISDEIPTDLSEMERHDLIHKIYDHEFLPFISLGPPYYPNMKVECNSIWGARDTIQSMIIYAARESASPEFVQSQRDLFNLLELYIDLRRTISAGLLLDRYPSTAVEKRATLRLFRDDFVSLRDFYIQVFEQCHRALRYIVGAVNMGKRGDESKFSAWPSHPYGRAPAQLGSMDAFSDLVSANKRIWLKMLPVWDSHWDEFFDRSLRNDIGHASVRHRLSDGALERSNGTLLPYLDFVRIASRSLSPLLAVLNAMKMHLIFATHKP